MLELILRIRFFWAKITIKVTLDLNQKYDIYLSFPRSIRDQLVYRIKLILLVFVLHFLFVARTKISDKRNITFTSLSFSPYFLFLLPFPSFLPSLPHNGATHSFLPFSFLPSFSGFKILMIQRARALHHESERARE